MLRAAALGPLGNAGSALIEPSASLRVSGAGRESRGRAAHRRRDARAGGGAGTGSPVRRKGLRQINGTAVKGVRWRAPARQARAAGDRPLGSRTPGKRRVGVTQLLKKFIKMSSSTERQSQKWHGAGGRGGGTGRGLGTRQSRRKQQRSESAVRTHTHANSNGDPTTNGKGGKKMMNQPQTRWQIGTLVPTASCPHPEPSRDTPRAGAGCWAGKMGGWGLLKKTESPWASETRWPRWEVEGGLQMNTPRPLWGGGQSPAEEQPLRGDGGSPSGAGGSTPGQGG